jgi:uncharacterized protein YegP (UPF0339 family)
MSLLLIMKVKRKLRVMDCLKRFCSSTRPYRNRQNWEQFDVIDRLGAFEMYSPTADIFKWRLDEKSGLILKSNANYLSELTCRNGILSALSRLSNKSLKRSFSYILHTRFRVQNAAQSSKWKTPGLWRIL